MPAAVHFVNIGGYLSFFSSLWGCVPGNRLIWWYVKKSYKNDPYRTVIEAILLLFALKYVLTKKYRQEKGYELQLSPQEINELVNEWEPEPLVEPAQPGLLPPSRQRPPVIAG